MSAWTFETLAAADRGQLEEVMLGGQPPDFDQLEGYIYCGWNHEWVGRLSGEKFKKGFRRKGERTLGYNEICRQDDQGYRGDWNVKLKDGRPIQVGYFRVGLISDEPPQRLYRPYRHAGHFNYNVDLNTWRNVPFRVIRDMVVLANPGDHSLMLSKAYFQVAFVHLFYCYFLLGHRQEIEHEPW
jgi:hypothetical protein